ncbi:interleukin-6-like [Echinops telfairi]|uniref:Interleukin-6-like n=1 Tax=Echinops telfairi TaxID=9371 RepID=A0AC55DUH9_ECHTE|nr:interleukin-6-like [Echinops telfairi]
MFSDIYKIREIADRRAVAGSGGKMDRRTGHIEDSLIGGNASAEGPRALDQEAPWSPRNIRALHLPIRNSTMKSLSTSTFSPVAFSLGLLLMMASAFPTPRPLEGDSKGDAISDTPRTSSKEILDVLMSTLSQVEELRKEICDKKDKCENSRRALAENNLNLPKMREEDRCFQDGFNKETCLRRIITGLSQFHSYMKFVGNTLEEENRKLSGVLKSIKALIQLLKENHPNEIATPDPTTSATELPTWQVNIKWLKNTTINLSLQSLEKFIQFIVRAVWLM